MSATGAEQSGSKPKTYSAMSRTEVWGRGFAVIGLLLIFLVGIRLMGEGFEGLGKDLLERIFLATSNPFVALTVGILGTTLAQSSSVTTSMIVAMVAAPGSPLPMESAIPMIMGANIGTTVTNTIVSLGHIARPQEFRQAFAAATCHDFFNFLTVLVLLPLELTTGYLRKSADFLAGYATGLGGGKLPNPIKIVIKGASAPIENAVEALVPAPRAQALLLLVISAVLIFGALALIVRTLRKLAATRMEVYINRALGTSPLLAILVGIVATVAVQSSSITTSVLIPLAGAGIITLQQVFPVTIGANIGTTVTALLASMAAPPETARLAVQIALVHLLFNLSGTVLIYPVAAIRRIPLVLAERLARTAMRSRQYALLYVALLFYGVPALLIGVSRLF